MRLSHFTRYLERLESTASRNAIIELLAEIFSRARKAEIADVCYLLSGELLPAYHGAELQVAEKTMIRVLAQAFGAAPASVRRHFQIKGDLGDVAEELAAAHRTHRTDLLVGDVYARLLAVTRESGEGSQERRVVELASLIGSLEPRAAKYVTRILLGKLRLGFSEATMLDALSVLAKGDKSARNAIEDAFNVTADIGAVAERLKSSGLAALARLTPRPGIPIRPSLAERVKTVEEIFEKVGATVGVEQKLDGFRTQIHVWSDGRDRRVALFSRNLENTTAMFPEIVAAAKSLPVKSAILDGETIGYDQRTGKFTIFQETVQRKRKHDIDEFAKKIPLTIFVFDLLYKNGLSLLGKPFRERRAVLERTVPSNGKTIRLAPHQETDDPAVIREEFRRAVAARLEGLVVKKMDAPYAAGKRGFHWVKLKATGASALTEIRMGARKAESQLLDTIDCVVMGAYRGRGKRAQFGVGGFLLGIRGPGDRYYSISRLGSGLSDEQFREARRRVGELAVPEAPKEYICDKEVAPDIWVRPGLVVEILADEITLSPRHTAGRGRDGRGYSLRFPRLVRFRDDKHPVDITSIAEIRSLYRRQNAS